MNQGESAAVVRAYLQREGLTPDGVWLDTDQALGPATGSRGLPTTLFFDAQGRRIDAHLGALNAAALQVRLQRLRQHAANLALPQPNLDFVKAGAQALDACCGLALGPGCV